jgi:hypothetical protein
MNDAVVAAAADHDNNYSDPYDEMTLTISIWRWGVLLLLIFENAY